MKKLLCSLALILIVATAFSQKVYFIYIQADLEQPFSVKLNEKMYHSSSSGYLILSKLRDSSYPVTVLFPQGKWPDQSFRIEVKSKDRGFLLKNFGDKGWGLYDLQTLTVQMSTGNGAADRSKTEATDVSAFTDVLSRAANDPSLRDKPVAIQQAVVREEKKPEPVAVVKKEETAIVPVVAQQEPVVAKQDPVVVKQEPVQEKPKAVVPDTPVEMVVKKADPPAVKDPDSHREVLEEKKAEEIKPEENKTVAAPEEYVPSVVKRRRAESSTSEGLGLSFIDEFPDGKKDTIRIIIPNPRRTVKDESAKDKKFLDITADTKDMTAQEQKPVVKEQKEDLKKEEAAKLVKEEKAEAKKPAAACTAMATDNDFLKLRRKMAAESGDDDMVSEAVKYFKTKCFTVAQVENLSTLFLNDAGKYKFFDAAYGHVADPDSFGTLQPELKDEYYINRFKAMMR